MHANIVIIVLTPKVQATNPSEPLLKSCFSTKNSKNEYWINFLSHDIIFVENGYHMRKLQAFEATGLKVSRTKSHAEYHPIPCHPSHRNPVNPVPTKVMGGILAAQDSMGISIPVLCEHWCVVRCIVYTVQLRCCTPLDWIYSYHHGWEPTSDCTAVAAIAGPNARRNCIAPAGFKYGESC